MAVRRGIKRFLGTSKFSNKAFFEFMFALASRCRVSNGMLMFDSSYDDVSIIEKMDGTFVNIGFDTQFYMQTRSSRRITIDNVDAVWGRYSDLGAAFHSLHDEQWLQSVLREQAAQNRFVSFEAELFASLTHVGQDGVIRFNVVPYSRVKVGDTGALVLFRAHTMSSDYRWVEDAAIIDEINDARPCNARWNIYTNAQHAVSNRSFVFDIGDLAYYLINDAPREEARGFIASRKRPPEAKAFYVLLDEARTAMQNTLDALANNWRSFLHGQQVVEPYVEGVILRFVIDDVVFEAKGTSRRFDDDKKIVWNVREQINHLDKMIRANTIGAMDSRVANAKIIDIVRDCVHDDPHTAVSAAFTTEDVASIQQRNDVTWVDDVVTTGREAMAVLASQPDYLDVDTARKNRDAVTRLQGTLNHLLRNGSTWSVPYNSFIAKYCSTPEFPYSQTEGSRVLIWLGRAQPWHRGHTEMVRMGLNASDEFGFDKVVLVPVRGNQSQKTVDNPLDMEQQLACMHAAISTINDQRIEIIEPIESASPVDVLIAMKRNNMVLSGWLAGEDRCDKYAESLFKLDKHMIGVRLGGVPCALDEYGRPNVQFILTPRVLSATAVRNAEADMSFDEWFKFTIGDVDMQDKHKQAYNDAYVAIGKRKKALACLH